jgi:hypothetical protein
MKNRIVLFVLLMVAGSGLMAQDSAAVITIMTDTTVPARPKTNWNTVAMSNRSSDHLLLQVSYDSWANKPDSIQTTGFSRGFNAYFLFDFPFKSSPKLSVAIGAGVSTSNIFFENTYIDITGKMADRLSFQNVVDTNHYKKYKLVTTFLEAPVELRFSSNPMNNRKSIKAALGVKIGTMVSAATKGKNLQNRTNDVINSSIQKEKAKRYFNTTRFAVTGRLGFGNWSAFGAYQVNAFIKEGFGPDVRPFSIGLTLSGL